MARGEQFSSELWAETRLLVGKLIAAKKFDQARKLLHDAHVGFVHPSRREGELVGMMFVLDCCHPPRRD